MFERGYSVPGLLGDQTKILRKVQYTDDDKMLYPSMLDFDEKSMYVNIGKLGRCKNSYWSFQSEWRYIIPCVPMDWKNVSNTLKTFQENIMKMINETGNRPISFLDLKIEENAFAEMEIMLSPKFSPGNRIIVNNLVKNYNPSINVRESKLNGLI